MASTCSTHIITVLFVGSLVLSSVFILLLIEATKCQIVQLNTQKNYQHVQLCRNYDLASMGKLSPTDHVDLIFKLNY